MRGLDAALAACLLLPLAAWILLSGIAVLPPGAVLAAAGIAALSGLAAPVLAAVAARDLRTERAGAAGIARLAVALGLCVFWLVQARSWLPVLSYS